ncbi:olfactory receptor 11A1-like [Ambystoma mexicanum]|uniref:olfactory receptor 11A1-like n=1 Tax=Ambystoma mexicanum TaxID=8296 RepID=UPI0037E83F13
MMHKMNDECQNNTSRVPEFLLRGFQVLPELKPFLFLVFLVIYMVTVLGNILIGVTVSHDNRLHSPMYFFLGHLSFLEIWYMTSTVPTMLSGLLSDGCTVSHAACLTQFYFLAFFATTECLLLTAMSCDRYTAICYPLHYSTLMDAPRCIQLVSSAWVTGFVIASITNYLVGTLEFSDHNEIDHFFCDFEPIVKAACSDTSLAETTTFVFSFVVSSVPFMLIIVSYVYIISAILRIPSSTGRQRAFSTCSSHLAVVIMYFGTLIALYVAPSKAQSVNLNKALSLLYTVATPLFNPIIYTLRNKEIRQAFQNLIRKMLTSKII